MKPRFIYTQQFYNRVFNFLIQSNTIIIFIYFIYLVKFIILHKIKENIQKVELNVFLIIASDASKVPSSVN